MMVRQADPARMTEGFGLYALSGKATTWLAPLSIAVITEATGSQRLGITAVDRAFPAGSCSATLGQTGRGPNMMIRPALIGAILALVTSGCGPTPPEPVAQAAITTVSTSGVRANQLFGAKSRASTQPPAAVGSYAKGCLAGAVQLPETGPTWQAMRLSRNRNWGHPDMISFIERLSAEATQPVGRGFMWATCRSPAAGR
jgi:hypothetical protein